jgi:hypothetical protein
MLGRGLVQQDLELASQQEFLEPAQVFDHGLILVFAEQADGFDFFVHACFPEVGH